MSPQRKEPGMFSHKLTKPIAIAAIALVLAGVAVGVISLTSGGSSSAATTSPTTAAHAAGAGASGAGGGGSNARSGPAAGGSIGTVGSVSASGFTLTTSAGQKVTVKVTSSTAYWQGAAAETASGVTRGESVLVLGTTNSTTITAARVIVQPKPTLAKPSWAGSVVAFTRGAQSASKQAGRI